jgi:diaminopimelate decarboxylase
MMPLDQVLPPSAAVTPEGHLSIGGCDMVALAEEHGTPLVVYDEGALRATARAYRAAFDALAPGVEIIYASKAYFGQAMLRLAREEGMAVDVASGGELFAALRAGFDPSRIYMHGNNKDAREVGEALDAGVGTLIADNLDEIALVDRLARERGVRQRMLVRVTPGVRPSTHS